MVLGPPPYLRGAARVSISLPVLPRQLKRTEVMRRVVWSPELGEALVIPGVVTAIELMWQCGVPMETGSVTIGTLEENSWFLPIVIGLGEG